MVSYAKKIEIITKTTKETLEILNYMLFTVMCENVRKIRASFIEEYWIKGKETFTVKPVYENVT